MAYAEPNIPSGRDLLARHNRIQLRNFKLLQRDQYLKLYPISRVPWIAARRDPVYYEKQSKPVSNRPCNSIDIIKKNGEFDSFIWHTSASKLKEATRWGIVKTQSVTSKVISALGQYRLIVQDRIEDGLISNRHVLKYKLLNHYQDRLEALEEIESLANRHCSIREFQDAFGRYVENLIKIRNGLTDYFSDTNFSDVDHLGIDHIRKEIQADIDRAKDFKKHFNFESSNRATGIDSVLTFVKKTMIRNLREMQNHNQNITYSRKMFFAATRGDLNSCIEDATKVIRDYNAPPRDAVDSDHHGQYGKDAEHFAYDSSYHCASPFQEHRALLAITFIEGMNTLDVSDPKHPVITTEDKKSFLLKVTRATKWETGGGVPVVIKRVGAWLANVGIKFFAGLIELPLTLIIEPLTFGYALPFFQTIRKLATFEIPVKNPKAPKFAGEDLLKSARRPTESLGMRVRHLAAIAFKNTFQDALHGVRDVYKQLTIHLFDDIYDDYADGAKITDLDKTLKTCADEIQIILECEAPILQEFALQRLFLDLFPNKTREQIFATAEKLKIASLTEKLNAESSKRLSIHIFGKKPEEVIAARNISDKTRSDIIALAQNLASSGIFPHKTQEEIELLAEQFKEIFPEMSREDILMALQNRCANNVASVFTEQFASPGFIPSAGEYDDALSSLADATDQFMEFFLHNIHAKHPVAGSLFTFAYIAGGLAVLAPSYVAFLGAQYIAFSQAMGYSMSKSPLTAAVSSAITQAQVASSVYELLIHGRKSWYATSVIEIEKDPFTSLIYVATALGFGYVVVYQLNIPWLSDMLKEDMGSFPPTSLAFVGAKLGVLVYELLMEHPHVELEHTESARKLREYLTEIYTKAHPDASKEDVEKNVNEIQKKILASENIESLKAAHNKLQNDAKLNQVHEELKEDMDKVLTRNRIIQFLEKNRDHLVHLSAKTKHQLVQQFKEHFSFDQARSLKKILYPEESTSILRTTLGIIIGYPAFMVRICAAGVSSLMQRSIKPLQSASIDFGLKILKDLTRVGRSSGKLLKTTYTFFQRHAKTFADVFVNSFLARGQALIANRHNIANAGYSVSATLDAGAEEVRQLIGTPVDAAIKVVTVAHPINTERDSYFNIIKTLKKLGNVSTEQSDLDVVPKEMRPDSLSYNPRKIQTVLFEESREKPKVAFVPHSLSPTLQ